MTCCAKVRLLAGFALVLLVPLSGCCPPVGVDAGDDVSIEEGQSVRLQAVASGGNGTFAYQWAPTTGLDDPTSRSPLASPTETTTYTVAVTSCDEPFAAMASDSVRVLVNPLVGDPGCRPSAGSDREVEASSAAGADVTLAASDVELCATPMFEWFEDGELIATGIMPTVSLPIGMHIITLRVTETAGDTRSDDVEITVLAPPVANAGADQTVVDTDLSGFEPVDLDGSASTDVDGTITSYSWTENGIEFSTDEEPTGVVLAVGTHNITLTVTDSDGLSSTDDVTVVVAVPPPVLNAAAGPDQTLRDTGNDGTELVTLDGSGSTAELTITSYRWIENNQVIITGVSPIVALAIGAHTITLEITDASGQTATDEVTITINALVAPTADAGLDRLEIDCDNDGTHDVVLDASGSTDPDGQIVAFLWTENGTELATTASATVSLTQGTHTIDLEVTDDDGLTGTDSVEIKVIPPPPLSGSAGADQLVPADVAGNAYTGPTVTLTATALDGCPPYTYAWSEDGASLGDTQSIEPTLTIGLHDIDLTVTDANTDTATDQVRVSVFIPSTTAEMLPQRTTCGGFAGICTGDSDDLMVNVAPLTVDGSTQQITILELEPQCVVGSANIPPGGKGPFEGFRTVPHKILLERTGSSGPEPIQFLPLDDFCTSCQFTWSEGETVFSTEPGPLTVLGSGKHVITASITDENNTETVEGLIIINPPAGSVVAGATSSDYFVFCLFGGDQCPTREVTLTATVTGGTGPYTYSWTPTEGLANPDAAVTLLTIGTEDTYTVTVTDTNGNFDRARVVLGLDCFE